ncbi:MAG: N-6 DNA methylase [Nanopusillaceae archaeon]
MSEKPTENTYVGEFIKTIQKVGEGLGFDAEIHRKTSSGVPDVLLKYKDRVVAVIEVKNPEISLSDPKLNEQALRYAEWYRMYKKTEFYGIHNMRFLKLFRYVKEERRRTIVDYLSGTKPSQWVPVSDFPFPIIPWITSIEDYKEISTSKEARQNLESFLLRFKEILEGKTLDLTNEVIKTIRNFIEEGASAGRDQLKIRYDTKKEVRELVDNFLRERGFERPKNDNELKGLLLLVLKEQIYTFTIKLLFYIVLQSIDAEMSEKLRQNVELLEKAEDPDIFKETAEKLFKYAIEKTGDFEEVFGSNTVDNLPVMPASLGKLREIVRYLNQIRWSDIRMDVIGRIFEGLIYEERRHLLGQHYTDSKIVDLILTGIFKKGCKPERMLDPACGSGTFLVRSLNYWRINCPDEFRESKAYELVEGCDIDKLASMLAKINLYISALEFIKQGYNKYVPKIRHNDFFKLDLEALYSYVATNPPYTRQEETSIAYYDTNYKNNLINFVRDITHWDKRASIYAYFLVKGGKLLKEGGRLGFIVGNSWMNAEYGGPLKKWFFDKFNVEYIIESLVERWFEDADVITNVIIAERKSSTLESVTRFVYLKKTLLELVNGVPPSTDVTASIRYYENIKDIYNEADKCPSNNDLEICDSTTMRVVTVKRKFIDLIESRIGRLGIVKGPKLYLSLVRDFLEGGDERQTLLGDVLKISRGLTTNANEIFYLPSRYWEYLNDTKDKLSLRYTGSPSMRVDINKEYLRRLIRVVHLTKSPYKISDLPILKKEDYVLWIQDKKAINDPGTLKYVEWAERFIEKTYELEKGKKKGRKFSTLVKELGNSTWLKLSSPPGGILLFRGNINKNYSSWLLCLPDAEPDQRLYVGSYVSKEYEKVEPEVLFGVVNSVYTYLGIELLGKTLGDGALYLTTDDYEKIPIVNPLKFQEHLKNKGLLHSFVDSVRKMLELVPQNIENEALRSERLEVEKYVFDYLGLSEENMKTFYDELVNLVKLRTERALKKLK